MENTNLKTPRKWFKYLGIGSAFLIFTLILTSSGIGNLLQGTVRIFLPTEDSPPIIYVGSKVVDRNVHEFVDQAGFNRLPSTSSTSTPPVKLNNLHFVSYDIDLINPDLIEFKITSENLLAKIDIIDYETSTVAPFPVEEATVFDFNRNFRTRIYNWDGVTCINDQGLSVKCFNDDNSDPITFNLELVYSPNNDNSTNGLIGKVSAQNSQQTTLQNQNSFATPQQVVTNVATPQLTQRSIITPQVATNEATPATFPNIQFDDETANYKIIIEENIPTGMVASEPTETTNPTSPVTPTNENTGTTPESTQELVSEPYSYSDKIYLIDFDFNLNFSLDDQELAFKNPVNNQITIEGQPSIYNRLLNRILNFEQSLQRIQVNYYIDLMLKNSDLDTYFTHDNYIIELKETLSRSLKNNLASYRRSAPFNVVTYEATESLNFSLDSNLSNNLVLSNYIDDPLDASQTYYLLTATQDEKTVVIRQSNKLPNFDHQLIDVLRGKEFDLSSEVKISVISYLDLTGASSLYEPLDATDFSTEQGIYSYIAELNKKTSLFLTQEQLYLKEYVMNINFILPVEEPEEETVEEPTYPTDETDFTAILVRPTLKEFQISTDEKTAKIEVGVKTSESATCRFIDFGSTFAPEGIEEGIPNPARVPNDNQTQSVNRLLADGSGQSHAMVLNEPEGEYTKTILCNAGLKSAELEFEYSVVKVAEEELAVDEPTVSPPAVRRQTTSVGGGTTTTSGQVVSSSSCSSYFNGDWNLTNTNVQNAVCPNLFNLEIVLGNERNGQRWIDQSQMLNRAAGAALVHRTAEKALNQNFTRVPDNTMRSSLTSRFSDLSRQFQAEWATQYIYDLTLKGTFRGFTVNNSQEARLDQTMSQVEIAKLLCELIRPNFKNDDSKNPWYLDTQECVSNYDLPAANVPANRAYAFILINKMLEAHTQM